MRVSAVLAAPAKARIRFRYGTRPSSSTAPSAAAASAASAAKPASSAATSQVTLRPALSEVEIAAVNSGIAWV